MLVGWTQTWQMSLNISKCVTLTCNRTSSPLCSSYLILNRPLKQVSEHPYLGVILDSKMSFAAHISHVTSKATRMLNFIRRNLYKCKQDVKCMAYCSLVRPTLEYASAAWDPYLVKDITAIESIQRRAARWVTSNFDWRNGTSITSTLADLQWPTLSQRRQISRLRIFHKTIYQHLALQIPEYYITTNYPTRHHHPLHFITPQVNTNSYKYSFFPRTIREWNGLPIKLIETANLDIFFDDIKLYLTN